MILSDSIPPLAQQCVDRCDVLAKCTEVEGEISRFFLSPPMKAVHQHVENWMRASGLSVRIDDAGNIVGRRQGGPAAKQTLMIGSHLDTVPNGGRFDGMLGVMVGLALVDSLQDANLPFHIDVIGFSEEEGVRFSQPYLGSAAIADCFDPSWLARRDRSGVSMKSVIEGFGLEPARIGHAAYDPKDVLGFVECHIEQGPVLARHGLPVGVVTAIVGQTRSLVRFSGVAGHAGTTPMYPRQDALVAASRWIAAVSDHGRVVEGLRATVGYASVSPNVRNVIPDRVVLSIDVRHPSDKTRDAANKTLMDMAVKIGRRDGIAVELLEQQTQPAAPMNEALSSLLAASVDDSGAGGFSMVSGAGHDAAILANKFPAAMLFVRQEDGISHHPGETVATEDVAVAIAVLHRFVKKLSSHAANRDLTSSDQFAKI